MIKSLLMAFVFLLMSTAVSAQTWEIWDKPKSKTDWAWNASKFAGLVAATADTVTTVQMLERGNVETNRVHNLLIDRSNPAPARRTALLMGQSYLANVALDYAYKRVNARKWKWLVIAARTALTVDSAKCAVYNSQLR